MTGAFLHCYLTPVESSEIQCRETPSISLDCTPPPFVASTSIAPRAGLFVTQDTVINHIETITVPPPALWDDGMRTLRRPASSTGRSSMSTLHPLHAVLQAQTTLESFDGLHTSIQWIAR